MSSVTGLGNVVSVVIDSNGDAAVDQDPVGVGANGHVVFVITNNDNTPHNVRIPGTEFAKKTPHAGVDKPIDPTSNDKAMVPAGDVGAIVLKIKDKGNFPPGASYPYKYNVHTSTGTLDPDLEVNN